MRRFKWAGLLLLLTWAGLAFWHSVKPLPPGTHVASLAARLAESQVDVLVGEGPNDEIAAAELAAIERAEQVLVLDVCPLTRDIAQHLLLRQRERPSLKIVLVSDPRNEAFGGTPAQYLSDLEREGVIVARARLERLRDSRALYSSLWRLTVGWWSDPFDEVPGEVTLRSQLRQWNLKADRRQLLVADDGAGGWVSVLPAAENSDVALRLRGSLARDILNSELQIAAWSTGDDRLPSAPPPQGHAFGSIDARFLSEGAIRGALLESFAAAGNGDAISASAAALSGRELISAAAAAVGRGARLKLLLDPATAPNREVAAELVRGGGNVEIRWRPQRADATPTSLVIVEHGKEMSIILGAMEFTRLSLADFNLAAAAELRLPQNAAAARALGDYFSKQWSGAAAYARHADESQFAYWKYRLLEASGLAAF